jgi:predicted acyl esterase
VRFGSKTSEWYQQHIEIPYFNYYLKGKGSLDAIKEANVFFTGANQWKTFDKWPPRAMTQQAIYLQPSGKLTYSSGGGGFTEYISDPLKPVPYTEDVHHRRTREYMTDDQRFASRRPDVLVFQTDILTEDLQLAGPVVADLFTSISTTDADFVVKLIDVFPDDFVYNDSVDGKGNGKDYPMDGYQMLVRGEVMRGRYRNSFENPEAFKPNEVAEVKYTLPDVAHTFKKGHRLMIQVQSSWFPLVDRNPQQFMNIYQADEKDFIKSTIRIHHTDAYPSKILLPVLK